MKSTINKVDDPSFIAGFGGGENIIFDSEEDKRIFFEALDQPKNPTEALKKINRMTEHQLVKLGFEKEEVSAEEAGVSRGYYFFSKKIGEVELISNTNDQLVDGGWACYFLDSRSIEIKDYSVLEKLIDILETHAVPKK